MDFRLLELMLPHEKAETAREEIQEHEPLGVWIDDQNEDLSVVRVLIDTNRTEKLSDTLSDKYSNIDGFRIILYSVEATLPQPKIEEEKEEDKADKKEESAKEVDRISREELYADVTRGSELNKVYIGLVILSTLVAAAGLIRDDVAVIIGAMVIAPLLGPNVSMALAVTLGDIELAWRSLKTNVAGLIASLGTAFVMGMIMTIDLRSVQIINHTQVSMGDITIALAAGSAGVLAFTRGVPSHVVGVTVALALLPALVDIGLLLGSGYLELAIGATILTLTNLICINLAGVVTFLLQGIRPRSWWEAEKAKKSTRIAIAIWLVLLAIFVVLIWFWGKK